MNELQLSINGVPTVAGSETDPLVRAVIISLFTWRRANADDVTEGDKMGYWGDAIAPPAANDRIGSRLWLLRRAKLTQQTFNDAREYAQEALAWLVEDGAANRVDVLTERYGVDGLAMAVQIVRMDGSAITLRFDNLWETARAV